MSPRECDCPGLPCTCAPRPVDIIPGDPRAPYEAVLTAWEQSGDVTRMWLAREFREAMAEAS